MTKPILDQARCMAILDPHLAMLHACVLDGFNTYHRTPPDLKAQHDERAATTTVYAHIMHAINREFAAVDGVSLIDSKGLKVLNFGDRLVARFKKVNESGRHRNHISKQQVRFDKQLSLPHLPPAATRVTIGYEPDPAFYEIVRVTVGCPHGHNTTPLWLAQINVVADAAEWVDVTPARIPATEPFERYEDDDTSETGQP
jgi:hypothetical protein